MHGIDSKHPNIATLPTPPTPDVDERRAIAALHALSQRSRLLMFRMLVHHEPRGLAAGVIAQKMHAPQNSTSVHLAVLSRAGLVTNIRSGRSVIYRAHLEGMRWLLNYLLKDCYHADTRHCAPSLAGIEQSPGSASTLAVSPVSPNI